MRCVVADSLGPSPPRSLPFSVTPFLRGEIWFQHRESERKVAPPGNGKASCARFCEYVLGAVHKQQLTLANAEHTLSFFVHRAARAINAGAESASAVHPHCPGKASGDIPDNCCDRRKQCGGSRCD